MTDIKFCQRFDEICVNCGCTYGSHLGFGYYSEFYGKHFPNNYCPGHEGRTDWDKGPGTTFESSGKFKEEEEEKDDFEKHSK